VHTPIGRVQSAAVRTLRGSTGQQHCCFRHCPRESLSHRVARLLHTLPPCQPLPGPCQAGTWAATLQQSSQREEHNMTHTGLAGAALGLDTQAQALDLFESRRSRCVLTSAAHLRAGRHRSAAQAGRPRQCCRRGSCLGRPAGSRCGRCLRRGVRVDRQSPGGGDIRVWAAGTWVTWVRYAGIEALPGVGLALLNASW
jgi:hypothetical protein